MRVRSGERAETTNAAPGLAASPPLPGVPFEPPVPPVETTIGVSNVLIVAQVPSRAAAPTPFEPTPSDVSARAEAPATTSTAVRTPFVPPVVCSFLPVLE